MTFKVLSWNINGLRSFKTDMKEFLLGLDADIICFQETKVTRDMLEEPLAIVEGFSSYFSFSRKRSGYSGVATFCSPRAIPIAAQEGLSGLFPGELSDGSGSTEALAKQWSYEQLKDLDSEGRAIITQHRFKDPDGVVKKLCIINVYCPRVDPDKPERRAFKLCFYELVRQRAAAIRASGFHVVVLGDVNTSHRRIDHCDPDDSEDFEKRLDRRYLGQFLLPIHKHEDMKSKEDCTSVGVGDNDGSSNCLGLKTDEVLKDKDKTNFIINEQNDDLDRSLCLNGNDITGELEKEDEFAEDEELLKSGTDFQMVDTFRYFHPERTDAFTCWNTLTSARATNYGTRIDYVLCDREFLAYVQDSLVLQDVMGSDHCPIAVIVEGELMPAPRLPDSCTKFFPEFRGQQQKLSSYFQPKSALPDEETKTFNMSSGLSRGGSLTEKLPQNKTKRKYVHTKTKSLANKKACVEKQTTLNTFFISRVNDQKSPSKLSLREGSKVDEYIEVKPPTSPSCSSSQESLESNDALNNVLQDSSEEPLKEETMLREAKDSCRSSVVKSKSGNQKQNTGWGFLMKAPPPPPLCRGHQEPCVLLTVKKKGPNVNRQFYTCARGVGKEGDPNARCNFFKWVGK